MAAESSLMHSNPFDKTDNQFNYEVYPLEPDQNEESVYNNGLNHRSAFDFENQIDEANKIPIDTRALTMIGEIQVNSGRLYLDISETITQKSAGNIIGKSQFTQYHVVGRDSLGPIDVLRRFSEFLLLKDMLFARYPGIVVPPIPAKKMTGSLDDVLVEERKYFLDQFLKAICETTYLACTPEI
jgi:hypothetical protein